MPTVGAIVSIIDVEDSDLNGPLMELEISNSNISNVFDVTNSDLK